MSKHIIWLQEEIKRWLAEGIISVDQAQTLNARYPVQQQNNSWGKIIFSAIGALLIGLGVILFFAYNWDAMHRLLKLALILGAVVASHMVGWYLSFTRPHSQRLGESLHLLGTLLFGAGIWLIAQIYHIDEHYPNGILLWSLGAIAMAWALNSTVQALLAMALLGFWCGSEIFDFRRELTWAPWMIGFLVIPFAWRKNSPLLMFFASILFLLLLFFVSIGNEFELVIHLLFILALGYMTVSKLVTRFGRDGLGNILFSVGTLVYFILLFAFSFVDIIDDFYIKTVTPFDFILYVLIPTVLVLGLGVAVWRDRQNLLPSRADQIDAGLKYLTVSVFVVSTLTLKSGLPAIIFNLALFVHSILYLLSGMEHLRWQRVAFGAFMLALLIFVRFLDLFDSLLLRSLAFIGLGVGLFVVGVMFSRQKEKELTQHG